MQYRFDDFELDEYKCQLRRVGEPIPLEPKVFDLLIYLVRHRRRVVARDELLAEIWRGTVVGHDSLSRIIKEARRALGDCGRKQSAIETIRGRGYRFIAAVVPVEAEDEVSEAERILRDAESSLEAAIDRGTRDLQLRIRQFVLVCRVAIQAGHD